MKVMISMDGMRITISDRFLDGKGRNKACVVLRKSSKIIGTGFVLSNGGFDPGDIPAELVDQIVYLLKENCPQLF